MNSNSKTVFFSLDKDSKLAKKIADNLSLELSPIKITTFADGEFFCQPLVSIRNKKVFIIHSGAKFVNENLMKLFVTIDACKRAAPKEINIIMPYFPYSRQDRKTEGRTAISAKLIADLITTAGADRLLLVELHSDQIQGFFNMPIDHVKTVYAIADYIISNKKLENLVVVAPDVGAIKRARKLAELLHLPLAIVDKQRNFHNKSESIQILGDVANKNCLILDDMIDTGGTIIGAAKLLKKFNAKSIYVCATHGLFSLNAIENFLSAHKEGLIEKVFVTDSVEHEQHDFLEIISISEFLSAILKIYIENLGSISELYSCYIQKIAKIKSS